MRKTKTTVILLSNVVCSRKARGGESKRRARDNALVQWTEKSTNKSRQTSSEKENDHNDPCEFYDEWVYFKEMHCVRDMIFNWSTSKCYVQSVTECDEYEESLFSNEA